MKIKYSHSKGIEATVPHGDTLCRFAVYAYGFLLNTQERRGRFHSPDEFAAAIREAYDVKEPRNALVISHLESLKP